MVECRVGPAGLRAKCRRRRRCRRYCDSWIAIAPAITKLDCRDRLAGQEPGALVVWQLDCRYQCIVAKKKLFGEKGQLVGVARVSLRSDSGSRYRDLGDGVERVDNSLTRRPNLLAIVAGSATHEI